MEAPFGLPIKWVETVRNTGNGEELYQISKGKEGRFTLFSAAIDDPNWIETWGKTFVKKMLEEWQTEETAPKEAAEAIRLNMGHLRSLLPESLELVVEGQSHFVYPLLFQEQGGDWFRGIFRSLETSEEKKIVMTGVKANLFPFLKEYFYTGKIDSLWKEEPEKIAEMHALAEKYGLKSLSEYVFRTFKNYLQEGALAGILTRAMKERSWMLGEELCGLLNNRLKGATISLEGSGLKIVLSGRVPDDILLFKEMVKTLEAENGENVPKELLNKVVSLKLSGSGFPEQLKGVPPQQLEKLDLSNTLWGWELVAAWAGHVPHLRTLWMSKTPPIPPDIWPALERLKSITEIDLSYQPEATPVFQDLLHATFPNLEKIILD